MKSSNLYYSVGPLMYCPANNRTIVHSIISERFGTNFSLALCLEDTIKDDCVEEAEAILIDSLTKIYDARQHSVFFLPQLFIRVRRADQIPDLAMRLGNVGEIVAGFIVPKFSLDNADLYINAFAEINSRRNDPFYIMPIYESGSIVDLRTRYDILYALKDKLSTIEPEVLNIRVGGNDLCHIFGFRRHSDESIHRIQPIASIFSDIITVYGMDYVLSGPVYEYFSGDNWQRNMTKEIEDDLLCGFIGKTVIHPNQIPVVNEACKVPQKDLDDAKLILNWDPDTHSLVSAGTVHERMNEKKTHTNWAEKILYLSEIYGTK